MTPSSVDGAAPRALLAEVAAWLWAHPLVLVAALVVAGVAALVFSWRAHRESGLPWSTIVLADDRGAGQAPSKSVRAPRAGVHGKPDGIVSVRSWGGVGPRVVVPLEVKPLHDDPRDTDLIQLGAYMVALEETEPAYGRFALLKTRSGVHRVPHGARLTATVRGVADAVRRARGRANATGAAPARSHAERSRCAACAYRAVCPESLA